MTEPSLNKDNQLPHQYRELPRQTSRLECKATFESIAQWLAATTADAPGLLVPLSGTDSVLTLMLCARAFQIQNRMLKDELLAIHYGESYPWGSALSANPLIARHATISVVNLKTDDSPRVGDPTWLHPERHRWAAAQTYALDRDMWIVGTRNRTEKSLGTFSIASAVAVVQPIIHLWKSDVLALCEHLGVPPGLMHASRCGDQQCGRPAAAAENIELIDKIIMVNHGELHRDALAQYNPTTVENLTRYVANTIEKNSFKGVVPYKPEESVVVRGV